MKAWKVLSINAAVCGISFLAIGALLGFAGIVGWTVGLATAVFAVGVALK